METIVLKPSLKIYFAKLIVNVGLLIGFILSMILILSIFSVNKSSPEAGVLSFVLIQISFYVMFPIIVGSIGNLISLLTTTYYISDNEIKIVKDFINKSELVYRIDQITKLTKKQSLMEKILNYNSIAFNIFGGSNSVPNGQKNQEKLDPKILKYISNEDNIYSKILSLMGISYQREHTEQPKLNVIFFDYLSLLLIINVIFICILYVIKSQSPIQISLELFILILLVLNIPFFINFILKFFRIRNTNYELHLNSVSINHNYFFSSKISVIPYLKITNVEEYKNIISKGLFNVCRIKLFTGGDGDSLLEMVNFHGEFKRNIFTVKSSNTFKKEIKVQNKASFSSEKSDILYSLRPNLPYFLKSFTSFVLMIIFLIVGLILLTINSQITLIFGLISFVIFGLFVIVLFIDFLVYKSLRYTIYQDRIESNFGLINKTKKEVYFNNIKYVTLKQSFFFQKQRNNGLIDIHTAGKNGIDLQLKYVKNSKEFYNYFKGIVRNFQK